MQQYNYVNERLMITKRLSLLLEEAVCVYSILAEQNQQKRSRGQNPIDQGWIHRHSKQGRL